MSIAAFSATMTPKSLDLINSSGLSRANRFEMHEIANIGSTAKISRFSTLRRYEDDEEKFDLI